MRARFRLLRSTAFLLGALFVLTACIVLYSMLETLGNPMSAPFQKELKTSEYNHLEDRVKQLEQEILQNQKTLYVLKDALQDMLKVGVQSPKQNDLSQLEIAIHKDDCRPSQQLPSKTDVQMLDLYKQMKFDNPDGGVWKQGWNVSYAVRQWNNENKLKVFVVPHSHNDPGWLKTFEKYFQDQTRAIFTNMVKKLVEDPRRKFIWAEISYFSLWWNEIRPSTRETVKKLVENKQLEIVSGGWVMPDEANSHFFAIIEQMIEGHQWLEHNLNYKPTNGWSIDPFGMSPTMAYLLKRMGFEHMLIQRVHYSVKKELAMRKSLEFRWRQIWDSGNSTDMFCHMMPFYSYDVPHTCGPDPKICCQFDFKRLPGSRVACPWRVSPQPITDENVASRSLLLLDQYRKKSQLFRTNVVLAPLGDDFRYDKAVEWDQQYNNYQKLFDYMNKREDYFVQAQFGTLEDYFNAVHAEEKNSDMSGTENFPSLSGDFFTYADRNQDYWSGYYTTRPFYKNMDRILEGYMRAAEMLYSVTMAEMSAHKINLPVLSDGMMLHLRGARRNFALFQHHDGITGTARDHVVVDYANKMIKSIGSLQHVIQLCADFLLSPSKNTYEEKEGTYFDLDDHRSSFKALSEKTTILFGKGMETQRVVIFNSGERVRAEVVFFKVSTPRVKVVSASGKVVHSQVNPVFLGESELPATHQFELAFLAEVQPFSLQTFYIHFVADEAEGVSTAPRIQLLGVERVPQEVPHFGIVESSNLGKELQLHNQHVTALFDSWGMLDSITVVPDNYTIPVHMSFLKYGAKKSSEMSGAYLFLPDGEAQQLDSQAPSIKVVEGTLVSYIEVSLPHVLHRVTLLNSPGVDGVGIHIQNLVNVMSEQNFELVMRIESGIANGNEFFTDLNGLQVIRRQTFSKLPLQANYYPMPTLAYIEDNEARLSILSAQPLGVAALKQGWIEVIQDRRLNQDDNRGLGQGVTDNQPTLNMFTLLLERKMKGCQGTPSASPASFPSLLAHTASLGLLHPFYRLIWAGVHPAPLLDTYQSLGVQLPSDIHIVTMYPIAAPPPSISSTSSDVKYSKKTALLLHRVGFDCCFGLRTFKPAATNGGQVNLQQLFPTLFGNTVTQMSLSLLYNGTDIQKSVTLSTQPMELYAFLLHDLE